MDGETKVCLVVIDGWGLSDKRTGNAILSYQTPVMNGLSNGAERYTTLDPSGLAVGLPVGLTGNDEVGHLNIGAGQTSLQDIVRTNLDMDSKKLGHNAEFMRACENAKKTGGRLHLLGLISNDGLHSHILHLMALLEGAKAAQVPRVIVHCFGDVRDTAPKSASQYLRQLLDHIIAIGYGEIGTVVPRYQAVNEDKCWDGIKTVYDGLVAGTGEKVGDGEEILKAIDSAKRTDEFLRPIVTNSSSRVQDNDTLVFCNYGPDGMGEIVETFGVKRSFETDNFPQNLYVICMTQCNTAWNLPLMYPPIETAKTIFEWLSSKKIPHFHWAETTNCARVMSIDDKGDRAVLEGRRMEPSAKVATYDLKPEMSAAVVADKTIEAVVSGHYRFVMCNFAPPVTVNDTGIYEAAVKATDYEIGRLFDACKQSGFVMLVTGDHGNAEQMMSPVTAQKTNRVPFIMANTQRRFAAQPADYSSSLDDVAPTVLDLLGVGKPEAMAGRSLLAGDQGDGSEESPTCTRKRVCDSPTPVSPWDSQPKRLKTWKMADLTSACTVDEAMEYESQELCGTSMASVYDEDHYPVLISALPPVSGGKDAGCPPVDLPLEGPSPIPCLSIPAWLLGDIFLHLDVYTRSRLMRVNRFWKCELEALQVDQAVQFVDFTEYLRGFIYGKLGGPQFLGQEDGCVIRWLSENTDKLYSNCQALRETICAVSDRYSTVRNGTLIVRLNNNFENDDYRRGLTRRSDHIMDLTEALLFGEARNLIFVDSVISQRDLRCSSDVANEWWSVSLLRSVVYCELLCKHLIQPLYVVKHTFSPDVHRPGAVWAELLDAYGELADKEALRLLGRSIGHRRKEQKHRFASDLASYFYSRRRGFDLKDDVRSCDLDQKDLSELYPSTIYVLALRFLPLNKVLTQDESYGRFCSQCRSLGH